MNTSPPKTNSTETATFGAGCFWCVETAYSRLKGVHRAISGYMGGSIPNPSYRDVCTGVTGHAEVVQVTFDPASISYTELLDLFWKIHDPTSLNRQGADIGTQYRSAVFVHSATQEKLTLQSRESVQKSLFPDKPIVTEIVPATEFYQAEDYHQDYYRRNPHAGYCTYVIRPKLEKLGFE